MGEMMTTNGLRFNETLAGFVAETDPDDFEWGFRKGRAEGSSFTMVLTIEADVLDSFISSPRHQAHITGTVTAPKVAPGPLTIVHGSFELLVPDATRVDTWNMNYELDLRSEDEKGFHLKGHKVVNHVSVLHAWTELSTLYTTLSDERGHVVATGILRISPLRFLQLLQSMKVMRPRSTVDSVYSLIRFALAFLRLLVPAYGPWPLGESVAFVPPLAGDPDRKPAPSPDLTHYCHGHDRPEWNEEDGDDVWLRLARFRPPDDDKYLKGPVVLAPGMLMSTAAFAATTIEKNLLEYLLEHSYEVWLFDWRGSTDLASARSNFTLDDVAREDWPTAVDHVCQIANVKQVQAIGHCMGSLTLQMAILAGYKKIGSAVCSQVTVHPVAPFFSRWKSNHHVGPWLQRIGFRTIQPETAPDLLDRVIDLFVRLNPFMPRDERCTLGVCRWITALLGPTHHHAQLNLATHREIVKWFGVGDLTALDHISLMISMQRAVDAHGEDVYLPHVKRMKLPILFLAGGYNRIFLPESSKRTMEWLVAHNGPALYERAFLPDYAHLDGFVGRNADKDVYPIIVQHLDAHQIATAPASSASSPPLPDSALVSSE
jgi:cholesterol oxidase